MTFHKILTFLIASVWLINGLFAKALNLVPRHQEIVASIFGETYSEIIVRTIGVAEIFMAIWILSRVFSRFNAITQITLVAAMNILEFIFARDLLLWGSANAILAFIFITFVYYNEFVLRNQVSEKP